MRTPLSKPCAVCKAVFWQPKTCGKPEWSHRLHCSNRCRFVSYKGRRLSSKTEFKKGHSPWCMGKKGTYKLAPEHRAKVIKTLRFGIVTHGLSKTPEYAIAATRKRDALKRGAKGTFTAKEWVDLKQKFQYMCLCCKRQEPFISLAADHIVPLSRGGSNSIENIQPLCKSCNSKKMIKTIDYRPKDEKYVDAL